MKRILILSDIDRGEGLNILDIVARARKNDPEFRFLPGAVSKFSRGWWCWIISHERRKCKTKICIR